jgi:hypothetical protein
VTKERKNSIILDAMHKSPLFYPEVVLRAGILHVGHNMKEEHHLEFERQRQTAGRLSEDYFLNELAKI